jgi:hypothetical protein
MPQKGRPNSDKADLVDELARLGGDDLRFWGEDGTQRVDDKSAAYKAYSGVSVAVLRSRVANFPPEGEQSESEEEPPFEPEPETDSSDEEADDQPAAATAAAKTSAPAPAPWFGGIFSSSAQPPDLVATKSRMDSGDIDDPREKQVVLQARVDVSDAIKEARLDPTAEELDVVTAAVGSVLEKTQREADPVKQASLIATMSSELDRLQRGHLPEFASAQERSVAERQRLDALQTRLERDGWDRVPATDSQLTPGKPVQEVSRQEREQQDTRINQRLQFDQAHVSTAGAQHAAATASAESETFESPTGTAASPPASPEVEAAVDVAVDIAVQTENERRETNMPSRVGTLVTGPPPQIGTAKAVTKLTQNLEDAPLVAKLVERGLLKTGDVLNRDYVQAMESRLRQQAATKAAEGRDVRYTSARAGFHAPANATVTATPGVYRVKQRRFLRPIPVSLVT